VGPRLLGKIGTKMTKPKSPHDVLDWFVEIVTTAGMYISAVAMTALFIAGVAESGFGAFHILRSAFVDYGPASYGLNVTKVIHGLELLLIAPVPFLIFDSLNTYLPRPVVNESDPDKAEILRMQKKERSHANVLRVKGFITGLLIALIATTSVGQALNGSLSLEGAAAAGIIMSILGIYFIALERIAVARRV
jgi:hypothetical protein